MNINTTLFGPQEISDQDIITFPQGLPGFEDQHRFTVFHEEGKPTVHWLQSLDDPDLCLSVMDPQLLNLGYEFELDTASSQAIEFQDGDEIALVVILSKTLSHDGDAQLEVVPGQSKIRANLHGPVVINLRTRKAIQASLPKLERLTLLRAQPPE